MQEGFNETFAQKIHEIERRDPYGYQDACDGRIDDNGKDTCVKPERRFKSSDNRNDRQRIQRGCSKIAAGWNERAFVKAG